MTRLGASRISSVFGLKVTAEHGDGLAAHTAPPIAALDALRHGDLALGVHLLHLLDQGEGAARLARGTDQRRDVLRKQEPP